MHRTRILVGGVLIAVGGVWIGQGSGVLRGTGFMVGEPTWILLGAIMVVVGIGVIWLGLRGRA
jgi:hypothetical protein